MLRGMHSWNIGADLKPGRTAWKYVSALSDSVYVFGGLRYLTAGGNPRAVPGLKPGFVPAGFSADGRFLTAFAVGEVPARRMRVDLAKGTVASLLPILRQNGVGVRAVYKMLLTSDERSSVYGYRRTQSNLLIVSGLR